MNAFERMIEEHGDELAKKIGEAYRIGVMHVVKQVCQHEHEIASEKAREIAKKVNSDMESYQSRGENG